MEQSNESIVCVWIEVYRQLPDECVCLHSCSFSDPGETPGYRGDPRHGWSIERSVKHRDCYHLADRYQWQPTHFFREKRRSTSETSDMPLKDCINISAFRCSDNVCPIEFQKRCPHTQPSIFTLIKNRITRKKIKAQFSYSRQTLCLSAKVFILRCVLTHSYWRLSFQNISDYTGINSVFEPWQHVPVLLLLLKSLLAHT